LSTSSDLWADLAAAESAREFAAGWLSLQCSMIPGAAGAAVYLTAPGQPPGAAVALWPRPTIDHERLHEAAVQGWAERSGVVIEHGTGTHGAFAVAYPCVVGEHVRAVTAVELHGVAADRLEQPLRQLQWGMGSIEALLRREDDDSGRGARDRLRTVLDLLATTLGQDSFQSAASAFATDLAARTGCERASLGFVDQGKINVVAISHTAHFNPHMNLVRAIGAAMEEAIDQRATVAWPETGDAHVVARSHAALAADFGSTRIFTVPIADDTGVYAALTMEFARDEGLPGKGALPLCETVAAFAGPLLRERRRAERHVWRRLVDGGRDRLAKLFGPRHFALKLGALAVVMAGMFLLFATGEYRVTAKAKVEGEVQRAIAAPFDGYIAASSARAGDKVTAGQELGRLDDKDLLLEQQNLASQRGRLLGEYREALATHDRAQITVKRASIDQVEAQLELVEEKLRRTRLVAPFDGVVVTGDISQSLGTTVARGQVLFELAPLNDYRVILQVDERDVADVSTGQHGTLVLSSLPEDRFGFSVAKITPVAESDEGKNYFRVEARLDSGSERLRPGMQGVSKIGIGERKLAWIWTHRLVDWLRLWSWTWLP